MTTDILILDDSSDLTSLYNAILTRVGVKAKATTLVDDFYQFLQMHKPKVIMLDVILTCANGREICKQLKSNSEYKDIPIILTSADSNKLKDYKQYDANDVLEKPFDIHYLVSLVKRYLNDSLPVY